MCRETYSRWDSHLKWDSHPSIWGGGRPPWWSPPWTLPTRVGRPWVVESLRDSAFQSDFFRTFLEPSRTFHKCTGSFPNLEYDFLYMNLILRTIPELLVMSGISSGTSNNTSNSIPYSSSTNTTSNLKCVTLRFANYVDMVENSLRPITNSGIWRSIMAPTYSTMT